ncbi:MAG: hypothetical protein AAGF36_00315 [Pseudomonadota bacterium]
MSPYDAALFAAFAPSECSDGMVNWAQAEAEMAFAIYATAKPHQAALIRLSHQP